MATPKEKLKRLQIDLDNPYPNAYKTLEERLATGNYGKGKQGPLTEGIRAKSERQSARSAENSSPPKGTSSGRSRDTVLGSTKNVAAPTKDAEEKESTKTSSGKSFSQAFREARSAGNDSFTWNGKKYNTELAKPKTSKADNDLVNEHFDSISGTSAPKDTAETDFSDTHFESVNMKKGGAVKKSSASSRGDGCCQRGKTKGKWV